MIRLCHVQVLPLLSGVQRSMLETLEHLGAGQFEPAVVCQSKGPLTDALAKRGIACFLVPELGREVRPWKDLRAYLALRRLFRREGFDIVHNQSAKPRVVGALAARHAGVPVVINHVRGYSFHEHTPRAARAVYERVEAWAARWCDATIFVNEEDRDHAVAAGLAPASRCHTVYNGADLASLAPEKDGARRRAARARYKWDPDEVVVSVLGRLEEQKQPLIVPKIARRLESFHIDKPWRIVLVGEGRLRPQVEAAIGRYSLGHRVQLLDWQSSPADVLSGSDVVLLPSLWEGLPRVLIEAHAAGLPCVASNIRGNREVVSDETGILVDPESVTAYATALVSLIESPLARARLGRAARRRAERLFDSRRNNAAIVRLYYEMLKLPVPQEHREAA
jgi:glycosyltransferase involved in cell wall biosynthesis